MTTVSLERTPDHGDVTPGAIMPIQRLAAKVAGAVYLLTMATAMFTHLYVHARLVVPGDAVRTAANIVAQERLFRVGMLSDLVTILGVVVLIWALYVVLKPIHSHLALLALLLRLTECAVTGAAMMATFATLRVLSGAAYLERTDPALLPVLARLFFGGQGAGLQIAFIFLGFGSAVFSALWLKSRFIPRLLAAWGIFASLALAIVGLVIVVSPGAGAALGLAYMLPMFVYEVGLGLWLLIMGLRAPAAHPQTTTSGE